VQLQRSRSAHHQIFFVRNAFHIGFTQDIAIAARVDINTIGQADQPENRLQQMIAVCASTHDVQK
jgi:hypothetical protein